MQQKARHSLTASGGFNENMIMITQWLSYPYLKGTRHGYEIMKSHWPTTYPSVFVSSSAHQLQYVCRWPAHLREGETPLYALQELSRNLVSHDVTLLSVMKLLARASLVDTNHGHTDGPCSLANTKSEIAVVCVDIPSLLESLDDLYDWLQQGILEITLLEFAE